MPHIKLQHLPDTTEYFLVRPEISVASMVHRYLKQYFKIICKIISYGIVLKKNLEGLKNFHMLQRSQLQTCLRELDRQAFP
jgi:hypothetical protein